MQHTGETIPPAQRRGQFYPRPFGAGGKCAHGIADTPVTATLASAIGRMERGHAAVVLAPTMHGSMHTSILVSNLRTLSSIGCTVVPPRDAYGKHNLPEEPVLVDACAAALQAVSLRPQ